MSEQETLAEAIERADDRWQHGIGAGGFSPPETAWEQALAAGALSWLASVLADDATVEVVGDALPYDHDGEVFHHDGDQIRAALAALSAHLAPPDPARAGDTSGEEGL